MNLREVVAGITVVAIAMAAVLGIFIARAVSKPEPAPAPKADRIFSFDTRWQEAGMVALIREPQRVPVERVILPEIIVEGATQAPRAEAPVAKPRRVAQRDVCRGKGRTYYRNGKWRCKR